MNTGCATSSRMRECPGIPAYTALGPGGDTLSSFSLLVLAQRGVADSCCTVHVITTPRVNLRVVCILVHCDIYSRQYLHHFTTVDEAESPGDYKAASDNLLLSLSCVRACMY